MDLFTQHVVTAVGITLVHFLWQGAAIGVITAAILSTCPRAMARTRYLIAGAGLVAMTTAPLVTLGTVWQTAPAMTVGAVSTFSTEVAVNAAALPASFAALLPWLPMAVTVWAAGVLLLTARLVFAWFRTEQVRRLDVHPVSEGLQTAVGRLAREVGIGRPIALFESPWIDVPTVIGWLKPTILLPIGALAGLSVQQIEAVLSHELAHIKRHDYLVNVLQNLAETVFFFHPAVWWLSRQIRVEREHCCDDVAVEACGNPVTYARALAALEESRQRQATFALAATDGSLVDRVRRLINPAHTDARRPSLPIAACVAVILVVLAFGGAQAQGQSDRNVSRDVLPDGPEMAESMTISADAPFERIDATTIQVEGTTYTRGSTAEGMARLLGRPRESAGRQLDEEEAARPVVEGTRVAPQTPSPLRIGGNIREPRKVHHVGPTYPEPARAAGISGVVILEATIDPEGIPVGLKILRSIPDLDQAAINAVRQWRYQPTLLNGVPVAVLMTVTVNFTLHPQRTSQEQLEETAQRLRRDLADVERRLDAERAATGGPSISATAPGGIRVGGAISAPRKVHDVPPVYPRIARASKVSGVVVMDVLVDAGGNVTDVRVLRSVPMLDNAAIDAVRQWKYEPTLLNGVPTSIQMTATVHFALD
jgi:TonB family protein